MTVREKASSNPEVVRFEINRSLTGMGHERYASLDDVTQDRPVDKVARTLLAHGGVAGVHVNSSVITVHLSGGSTGEGLREEIENLFKFYRDEVPVDGGAAAGATPDADAPAVDDTAAVDVADETDGPADAAVEATEGAVDAADDAEAVDSDTDGSDQADDAHGDADVAADETPATADVEASADAPGSDDGDEADASEADAAGEDVEG